jgi:hypothetical protein
MLGDESALVIERVNGSIVTDANLLQSAIGSILSMKMGTQFQELVDQLNVETRVLEGQQEYGSDPPDDAERR